VIALQFYREPFWEFFMAAAVKWQTDSRSDHADDRITLLVLAAQSGDCARIEGLIARGTDLNKSTPAGTTALMMAAIHGQLETVRFLIDRGAAVNQKRSDGFTALIFAAFFGHDDVILELLRRGADPDARSRRETSAEMWAASRGFMNIVDILQAAPLSSIPAAAIPDEKRQATESVSPDIRHEVIAGPMKTTEQERIAERVMETGWNISDVDVGEGIRRIGPPGNRAKTDNLLEDHVKNVPPYSPLSVLKERLSSTSSMVLISVTIVIFGSGILGLAVWRSANTQRESADNGRSAEKNSSSAEPSSAGIKAPGSLQPESSPSAVTSQKATTDESSSMVGPPSPESQDVLPDDGETEIKETQVKTLLQHSNIGPRLGRQSRRWDRTIRGAGNNATVKEVDRPAPVTFVNPEPTPKPKRADNANTLPPSSVAPLAGSTSKKKVIQWP
jgi:hypothetical protein